MAQAVSIAPAERNPLWKLLGWQAATLMALVGFLYAPTLVRLTQQWWSDPNFSHGFLVPAFAGFAVWQNGARLAAIRPAPSMWGLAVILLSLCVLVLGVFGAELFLSRISLLMLATGMVLFFLGWEFLRAILFPMLFLVLMIPLPAIIFSQITFPLQILASKLAASALPFFGVPVFREGNVINLPALPLEVAEACSGIRSLLSLMTLAIMYGYLLEKRIAMRVVLALAAVPIAVAANGLRIVGTGLLVQYWDPEKAEGFFHTFSGWLIFVVSLLMLFVLHRGLSFFWPPQRGLSMKSHWRFGIAAALLAGTTLLLYARNSSEIIPAREPLASFPRTLGAWTSSDIPLSQEVLDILGPGDFLLRDYQDQSSGANVDLFIAYFPSQRSGDAIHSPKNCLPGAGWSPVQSDRVTISVPGHAPFSANRYLIAKGEDRRLVLYWYWAHDRAVASEYAAKFYLVTDSIRQHRSDGSLIRVTTGLAVNESLDSGQQRLLTLAGNVVPLANTYIPR